MARKPLPDIAYLRQRLRYDAVTGELFWLPAEPWMFTPGRYSSEDQCATWNTQHAGREAGHVRKNAINPYVDVVLHGKIYKAHRLAWKLMTGEEPPALIDHCDGISTNNAWSNLRAASASQNGANSQKRKIGSSQYKGVSPKKRKWAARITVNRRTIHIGYFATEEDAARAYDAAAIAVHGEFAALNFPLA